MEEFRKKLKRNIKIYWAIIIAGIVVWIGLNIAAKLNDSIDLTGSSFGGLGSFVTVMAINILQYSAALKDNEKLKKLYIAETDERMLLIQEKSYSLTLSLIIVILAASAFVTSFFSKTVFYTIGAVLLVILLIGAGCQFYYSKKY